MLRSVVRAQQLPASDVSKARLSGLQTDVMFNWTDVPMRAVRSGVTDVTRR